MIRLGIWLFENYGRVPVDELIRSDVLTDKALDILGDWLL